MDNKKKIYIIILIILILLLVIIASTFKAKNKETKEYKIESSNTIVFEDDFKDPSIVNITNDLLNSEHCQDNICVSITKISCNENLGSIYYKITNKGNSEKDGYYMINLDGNKFYLKYDNLEIGQSKESYHNYKNINLTKINDFKLSLLSDDEGRKHFK